MYVEDHANALLTVVEKGEIGRTYNVGGNAERTNIDVVRTICQIIDELRPGEQSYEAQIEFVTDRPGHDFRYAIDANRIETELGFRPSVTFEEGIKKTVEWYLENEQWWKPLLDRAVVKNRLGNIEA